PHRPITRAPSRTCARIGKRTVWRHGSGIRAILPFDLRPAIHRPGIFARIAKSAGLPRRTVLPLPGLAGHVPPAIVLRAARLLVARVRIALIHGCSPRLCFDMAHAIGLLPGVDHAPTRKRGSSAIYPLPTAQTVDSVAGLHDRSRRAVAK